MARPFACVPLAVWHTFCSFYRSTQSYDRHVNYYCNVSDFLTLYRNALGPKGVRSIHLLDPLLYRYWELTRLFECREVDNHGICTTLVLPDVIVPVVAAWFLRPTVPSSHPVAPPVGFIPMYRYGCHHAVIVLVNLQ